ncbi:hypothetical protein H6G00_01260 [Leptolyngbya sp. FACHB-541]|uniref:hypothetical protein n=1 Tax=Leptolyngbya sp. FACHB-541 TaxID=2692810 RepID=UPI0016842830|nr:hypothetical protein [Leptolyngbya sp. FACHB-541]MBD1995258.1 hypothetical protein [Leptolyngbya sp. FACHB-541]
MEPQNCSQCPFWQESNRTPNVGYCPLYDQTTLGHDLPSDLCLLKFWEFAQSPVPACNLPVDFYRGWQVEVEQEQEGFRPLCRSPEGDRCGDWRFYQDYQSALIAGRQYVDLDATRMLLSDALADFLEAGLIDVHEYFNLTTV